MRTSNKSKWVSAAKMTLKRYEDGLFDGGSASCALCKISEFGQTEERHLCFSCIFSKKQEFASHYRLPCVHMLTYPTFDEYYEYPPSKIAKRIEFWKRAIPMLEAMPSHRFERKVIAKKAVAFPELWALDKCVKYENTSHHSW